ncbi:MAG: lipocalin family protein [Burkholderiales bacterium]
MKSVLALSLSLLMLGCKSSPPLPAVSQVDLPRFMGDWYVIANIPTFIEKGAHNAVESYRLAEEGIIETTFTFRKGSFDGSQKRYTPRGYVRDKQTNAIWAMQFLWPIKADYRIIYLNPDYSQTVIGRQKRDYAWIMARTPSIPEADYDRLVSFLGTQGYDATLLQKVPQRWPSPRHSE